MYLVLLPILGLFTIKFNRYDEILEVKKKNSDRPTNTGGTGLGKGKQKYFYGWPNP